MTFMFFMVSRTVRASGGISEQIKKRQGFMNFMVSSARRRALAPLSG